MGKSVNDRKMPDFGDMAKGMVQGAANGAKRIHQAFAVNTGIHSRETSLLRTAIISYRIR